MTDLRGIRAQTIYSTDEGAAKWTSNSTGRNASEAGAGLESEEGRVDGETIDSCTRSIRRGSGHSTSGIAVMLDLVHPVR
jgi:hypothetical protein